MCQRIEYYRSWYGHLPNLARWRMCSQELLGMVTPQWSSGCPKLDLVASCKWLPLKCQQACRTITVDLTSPYMCHCVTFVCACVCKYCFWHLGKCLYWKLVQAGPQRADGVENSQYCWDVLTSHELISIPNLATSSREESYFFTKDSHTWPYCDTFLLKELGCAIFIYLLKKNDKKADNVCFMWPTSLNR